MRRFNCRESAPNPRPSSQPSPEGLGSEPDKRRPWWVPACGFPRTVQRLNRSARSIPLSPLPPLMTKACVRPLFPPCAATGKVQSTSTGRVDPKSWGQALKERTSTPPI